MNKDNNKKPKSQVSPSSEEKIFLSDYTENSFWDDHKSNTEKVSNIYSNNPHFENYGHRTKTCSEFLTYANRLDLTTGELNKKLVNANFCRVRLCPVCQWRRSLMWQARFYNAIPKIIKTYPTYRFLFLTLTVKNCSIEDLSETIITMNKSFRKMLKFKKLNGVLDGWLKTVEITKNEKTNEAHPHFHILIMTKNSYFKKRYISQMGWAEMWQKALKTDYMPNVDIRTVKNKNNKKVDDLTTAVNELLKYSVKETDLVEDPNWLYELTNQVLKKRFISSGGILKNILKEEREEKEDLLNDEELTAIEEIENKDLAITFKFNRSLTKYKKYKVAEIGETIRDQDLRRNEYEKLKDKKTKKEEKGGIKC